MDRCVDLASFAYLGLMHRPEELRSWDQFISGRPAAIDNDYLFASLAERVAALTGCEAAVFATSTLHAFSDLCAALGDDEAAVFLDEDAYSITHWSVERAAYRHVPIFVFRHHDVDHLEFMLTRNQVPTRRPVVFVDGISAMNWTSAPLCDYLRCIEHRSGILVVDDTQSIGLLGHSASPDAPYGFEGGGSLRWHEIESSSVLVIASLAKAFSVPIAVVAGSRQLTDWFSGSSQTRVHCSPPSAPTFCALEHALDINQAQGDELRARLAENVRQLQHRLAPFSLPTAVPYFPVQHVPLPSENSAQAVDAALRARGICVTSKWGAEGAVNLMLVVTSAHSQSELEYAANALTEVLDELDIDPQAARAEAASTTGLGPMRQATVAVRESFANVRRSQRDDSVCEPGTKIAPYRSLEQEMMR